MQHSEFLLSQKPGVTSARGAKQWLRDLPLSDARSAHHAAVAMLAEWEDSPTPAEARLEVLETVRPHVATIDAQYSRAYADKPLPLGLKERNALNHAQTLWRRLASAYLTCFEASLRPGSSIAAHGALCLTRAGTYFCAMLAGRLRAGQAPDPDLPGDLQRLVELAGEHGLTDAVVRDSLHPRGFTNVAATYRRALFIAQVGHTAGGRMREAMFDLAHVWEGKSFFATPLSGGLGGEPAPAAREKCVLRTFVFGDWRHVVDVTRLARSLRRRVRKIDAGLPFEEWRLPEAFRSLPARDVLARLDALWCAAAQVREVPATREAVEKPMQRVGVSHADTDFDAMYLMVAGEGFLAGEEDPAGRRRFDEIFVFQGSSQTRREQRAIEAAKRFEDWDIVEEVAGGFVLRRPRAGVRLRAGQLMAMRLRLAGDDGPVVLAQLRHVVEPTGAAPGAVEVRADLLPGKPHGVAVRACGINVGPGAARTAAFRQGSLYAHETVSLVLPGGWFRPDRLIEVTDSGRALRVKLVRVVMRGTDFELLEGVLAA